MSTSDLRRNAETRYGCLDAVGPAIRQRIACDYYSPDEYYECLVSSLVSADTNWLDFGCGRELFPGNPELARQLSDKCRLLVGIDPDETIHENRYVHQAVHGLIEDYEPDVNFELITLRMVAEHIANPEKTIKSVARVCRVGGRVVIYTVSKWAASSVLARVTPFRAHHIAKKWLWKTEEKDTFPVQYRMNTRRKLNQLFRVAGFENVYFENLPDVVFWRFRWLRSLELRLLKTLQAIGLPHYDLCILAVYQRVT